MAPDQLFEEISQGIRMACGTRVEIVPEYHIKQGLDGMYYAVFASCFEAYQFEAMYEHYFGDCPIVCFGNYDNAFYLGALH